MEKDYPRLCGGTFFTLLLEARKQRAKSREHINGERDGLSETDVMIGLLKVINPDYMGPSKSNRRTFDTVTSNFKSCKISKGAYLPFDDVEEFNKSVLENYSVPLKRVYDFVENFLEVGTSTGKDIRLVKAVIEVVSRDQSIEDTQNFYINEDGSKLTKATLNNVAEVFLPSFLLGIWHFILINRKDNQVGIVTYDIWCPPGNRAKRIYKGNMGSGINRKIRIKTSPVIGLNQGVVHMTNEVNELPNDNLPLTGEKNKADNSLTDMLENKIDECKIAEFVDSDFFSERLTFNHVVLVDEFIEDMRNSLRSFRRVQDETYKNVIKLINAIEDYSGQLSLHMICDDGIVCKWIPSTDDVEIHEMILMLRRKINTLYALITHGRSLSVFGGEIPSEIDGERDSVDLKNEVVGSQLNVNNYDSVQKQENITIDTMNGDIHL